MLETVVIFFIAASAIAWIQHATIAGEFNLQPDVDFDEIPEDTTIRILQQDSAVKVIKMYDSHEIDEETFSAFNEPDPV